MNRMMDDEEDALPRRGTPASRDKEYTLGTGMVLILFFALALICSVFFGFGYTLGRKSLQPATASTADGAVTDAGGDTASFSKFKPAPGNASQPVANYMTPKQADAATAASPKSTTAPAESSASAVAPPKSVETRSVPAPVERVAPEMPMPVAGTGTTMVQIAALSHQGDADLLTAALKRRGYAVVAHQDAGDPLIHVQIGPYGSRKDAEVMRQRLLADGYNAILK